MGARKGVPQPKRSYYNNSYTSPIIVSKLAEYGRGWPKGFLFDSYYTEV